MADTTEMISNKISNVHTWEEMQKIIDDLPKTTLCSRVEELCQKRNNKSFRALSELAALSKTTFYSIMNGEVTPKKKQIIQIAFALDASLEELNELLKLAKLKELYAKNTEDAIVIFGMKNGLDLGEIDRLLEEKRCKLRFEEFRR